MADAHADGLHAEQPREFCPECEGRDLSEYPAETERVLYREAFATLDELIPALHSYAGSLGASGRHAHPLIADLGELGGRVKLPDGSVLEVEARSLDDLVADLYEAGFTYPNDWTPEAARAAWNAEHGIGLEA